MKSIFSVAKNTLRETLRSGVLWAEALVAGLLLFGVGLFGAVSIGSQALVVKDFSFFVMSFLPVVFVTLVGASIVQKEIARKTIYHVLSKPVSRSSVLIGKFFGLFGVALSLFLVALAVSILAQGVIVGDWLSVVRPELLLIIFELLIVSALVIFFSSIVVTPLLTGVFTLGVFLAGRSIEYIKMFIETSQNEAARVALRGLYWVLPSLSDLVVRRDVVLGVSAISLKDISLLGVYSLSYAVAVLIVGQFFFSRRDFP
jgi:Cu-processing system permease protein